MIYKFGKPMHTYTYNDLQIQLTNAYMDIHV